MNIKVFQNRKVSKDYFDNEGTQNENYSTTLSFEVPLGYEDFSKRIVFITEDGNFWDYIKDNEYVIKNNITKYENVEAYLWLTKDNQDFRSETFELNFYENQNPDDMTPSEEQLDGYNTLIAELELKVEEVDTLKEETLEALEKLKEQQIDYENRFKEINDMLKELKDTNEYQSEIIDQFKNEFDEKEFKGANAHLPDSAELPLKLQPQGNIEQEVIEAIEGIVVEGSSINVNDVDINYEDSMMPKGNIEQDSRQGYNELILVDSTYNINGGTIEVKNGIVTINGTFNTNISIQSIPLKKPIPISANQIVSLYAFNNQIVAGLAFRPISIAGTQQVECSVLNNRVAITWTASSIASDPAAVKDGQLVSVSVRIPPSVTVTNFVMKPMYVIGNDLTKDYELGGISPSLAFPSEVKGVSGHYDTLVQNKNLAIKYSNGYINGNDGSISNQNNENYFVTHLYPIPNDVTQIYYYASNLTSDLTDIWANRVAFYDEYKKMIGNTIIMTASKALTVPTNAKYVRASFLSLLTDVMLSFGVIDYVEPQVQNLPLDIPFNMYSGKPYKENGKWYRPIKSVKLPFNTDIFKDPKIIASYVKNHLVGFVITIRAGANNFAKASNVYSNKFKNKLLLGSGVSSEENVRHNRGIATSPDNTWQLVITIEKTELEKDNIDMTSAEAIFNWLIAQDFYIVLEELLTPYAEEITDTTLIAQLEALQNAEFYDGVTNINSYRLSEDVAEMPLEAHYNFITPSPSVDRPSEVLEVGSEEDINKIGNATLRSTGRGVTLTNNEDGSFTLNGTSTDSIYIDFETNIKEAGDYKVAFNKNQLISSFGGDVRLVFKKDDTSINDTTLIGKQNYNLTFTENNLPNRSYIWLNKGNMFDNFTFYPSVTKGTEIKPYTPYGYCRYENVVENKNIFNKEKNYGVGPYYYDSKTKLVSIRTNSSTYTNYRTYNLKLKPNTTYSATLKNLPFNDSNDLHRIMLTNNNDILQKIVVDNQYVPKGIEQIYTFTTGTEDLKLWLQTTADIDVVEKIQLEIGEPTEYIEHQEQLFPIDLPIGMKMYNDEFFYKENGKWYRKVEYLKTKLKSDMSWALSNSGFWYYVNIWNYAPKANSEIWSTHFKMGNWNTGNATQKNIISLGNGNSSVVGISVSTFESLDSFKSFLDNNEVYIVGELAKPYPEEITDANLIAQLEKTLTPFSYYPVTNINSYRPTTNVADLILNGKYYVSNKAKFKTLEERVSALENETVNE